MNRILKVTYKNGDVVISNELDELNYAISNGYIEKIEFDNQPQPTSKEVEEALELYVIELMPNCWFSGKTLNETREYDSNRTLILNSANFYTFKGRVEKHCKSINKHSKYDNAKVVTLTLINQSQPLAKDIAELFEGISIVDDIARKQLDEVSIDKMKEFIQIEEGIHHRTLELMDDEDVKETYSKYHQPNLDTLKQQIIDELAIEFPYERGFTYKGDKSVHQFMSGKGEGYAYVNKETQHTEIDTKLPLNLASKIIKYFELLEEGKDNG